MGLHPLLSWLLAVGPCHHLINKQFLREELPTVLRPYARGWGVVQKGRHYLSLHTVYNHGSFPQKQSMSYATHCKKKQKLKFPSILSTLYLEVVWASQVMIKKLLLTFTRDPFLNITFTINVASFNFFAVGP